MAKKSKSQRSRKIAQNALEIANRELGDSSDEEPGLAQDWRQNGTIVNPQKGNSSQEEDEFEDEELDSDDALGSDDDYDVLNSKFSQTVRDRRKAKGSDIYEDEEEEGGYTSIEEDDLLPLSQVWDIDDSKSSTANLEKTETLQLNDDLSDSSSDDGNSSSEDDESESQDDNPFDEISEDEEDLDLHTITKNLQKQSEKNQFKKLENQVFGKENEYSLPSFSSGSNKLNIADMMRVVEDKSVTENAVLIKSKTETLPVPLPQRIQKRHDRKAAYEISKEEVGKWRDIVQQNRQAEHISFPLNPPVQHNDGSMFVHSTEKTLTELEKKVDNVLKESNLINPEEGSTFEEIATAKMDPEEMKKRTKELRLMRELMFREERKAKRIKKIKSKAYHRIKKKELTKNKELIEDSEESDTEQNIARARERMSLKHKTTSKWAKDMVKHGMTKDKETREEMEEMLRQGERLRAKVMGHESGDESDSGISDIEKDDKYSTLKQVPASGENIGKSGVMNMAFMKKAEARQADANRRNLENLRSVENGGNVDLLHENSEYDNNGANVNFNLGRRRYTPNALQSSEDMTALMSEVRKDQMVDDATSLDNRLSKAHNDRATKNRKVHKSNGNSLVEELNHADTANKEINPWLTSSNESHVKKSGTVKVVDESSSKLTKSANKIEKERVKQSLKSTIHNPDEELLLDVENANKLKINDPYGDVKDTEDGFMFKQQDLIAEAFAGDDVVEKFQQEKKRVAIDEDDKIEDVTLPGWGEWAGAGAAPVKRRKFKKTKGTVEKDKRKDRNLKNVIINEKVNKKNLKYQSSAVPFPFESKEQYERSLRMPLGQEWTSRTSHQTLIKPRILTKPGTVIDPLKAPFK